MDTATLPPPPPILQRTGWTITWHGRTWADSDLTVQHLASLAVISGDDSFGSLDLTPRVIADYPGQGFMRLVFMLSALLVVDATSALDGEAAERAAVEVLQQVQQLPADAVLGCIKFT